MKFNLVFQIKIYFSLCKLFILLNSSADPGGMSCSLSVPGAMGWSALCDRDSYWSYSLFESREKIWPVKFV